MEIKSTNDKTGEIEFIFSDDEQKFFENEAKLKNCSVGDLVQTILKSELAKQRLQKTILTK